MRTKLNLFYFLLILSVSLPNQACRKTDTTDFDRIDHPFEITECTLLGVKQVTEIYEKQLVFYVPDETNVKDLNLNIRFRDPNTVINPSLETVEDFENPRDFILADGSGNTQNLTVVVKKSPWKILTNSANFDRRDGAGLVEFNNRLWLIGGWRHEFGLSNEVWSSADGTSWTLENDSIPWQPRHSAGFVTFNNKLWVISGDGIPDVWSSVDGKNWKVETANAPWGKRYSPYVAVFQGKLWLMGGLSWWSEDGPVDLIKTRGFNDIWNSDDGKTWRKVLENAPWNPRGLIHGFVVLNNELYILGGGIKNEETIVSYNDVWKTIDGIHWTKVLESAPWRPRTHFSVTAFNGKIWLTDGSVGKQSDLSNEVWVSENGVHWAQVKHSFWERRHASSLTVYNKKLWLVAGYGCNDVNVLEEQTP